MSYEFYNPTRVLFGAEQLNHLHEQKMPGKRQCLSSQWEIDQSERRT